MLLPSLLVLVLSGFYFSGKEDSEAMCHEFLYYFSIAIVTLAHKLGGLKQQTFILWNFGSAKSKFSYYWLKITMLTVPCPTPRIHSSLLPPAYAGGILWLGGTSLQSLLGGHVSSFSSVCSHLYSSSLLF